MKINCCSWSHSPESKKHEKKNLLKYVMPFTSEMIEKRKENTYTFLLFRNKI